MISSKAGTTYYATACIGHYINCENTVLYRNPYSNIQNIYRNSKCSYIGIISRILTDSYRVNKREYGLRVFIESLYSDIWESYSINVQEIFFCIQPYSARIREDTVQKNPYSWWFYVVIAFYYFHIHIFFTYL